ncbi:hypothetical protein [Nocardia nepalensis]|uniref:hypothetical protein n=1 Tax=Nocardia nepalensis TaxID=3375448 RepID=UPI003B676B3E
MDSVRRTIAEVDWAALEHAYGSAEDAPAYLLALLDGERDAGVAAVGYLDSALLHQGSLYSATAPFVAIMAELLPHQHACQVEDTRAGVREPPTVLQTLLAYLAIFAEVCNFAITDEEVHDLAHPDEATAEQIRRVEVGPSQDEEFDWDAFDKALAHEWALQAIACRAVVPGVITAIAPLLDDPHPPTRLAALTATVHLMAHPACADDLVALVDRLDTIAPTWSDPAERATVARLSGIYGGRPELLLDDPDVGVRGCAALAPALSDDPRATHELLTALQNPQSIDEWFETGLPGQRGWLRHDFICALLSRAHDAETVLPVAIALVQVANSDTVDQDCIPFVQLIFPDVDTRTELSDIQRAYLVALVAADDTEIWVSGLGSELRRVGLPADREDCRRLVEQWPSD